MSGIDMQREQILKFSSGGVRYGVCLSRMKEYWLCVQTLPPLLPPPPVWAWLVVIPPRGVRLKASKNPLLLREETCTYVR